MADSNLTRRPPGNDNTPSPAPPSGQFPTPQAPFIFYGQQTPSLDPFIQPPPAGNTLYSEQVWGPPQPPYQSYYVPPPVPSAAPRSAGSGSPTGTGTPAPGLSISPATLLPRKRRGGLLVLAALVLLVVVPGSILGTLLLLPGVRKPTHSAQAGIPPTTTQGVPTGFLKFSNSAYSLLYPQDWTARIDSKTSTDEGFTGPDNQVFQVAINPGDIIGSPQQYDDLFCALLGDKNVPVYVTIGGQEWLQEDCGSPSGVHFVVDAILYKGHLCSLGYGSKRDPFQADKTHYYQPMEQSFQFLL